MRTDTVCQTVAHSKLESCKLRIHHMPIRLITDKCWIARFLPWLQLFQQQVHWRPDRLDEFFAPLHTWKLTFTIHLSDYACIQQFDFTSQFDIIDSWFYLESSWMGSAMWRRSGTMKPRSRRIYNIYDLQGSIRKTDIDKKGVWPDEDLPPPSSHSQQTDPMLLLAHVLRQFQQSPKF